jgi:hypothetical protein
MLLRQPDINTFKDVISTEEVMEDWELLEDILVYWRHVIQDCLKHNLNERIGLRELVAFWDNARYEINES